MSERAWLKLPGGLRVHLAEVCSYRDRSSPGMPQIELLFRSTSGTVVYRGEEAAILIDALDRLNFDDADSARCEAMGKEQA